MSIENNLPLTGTRNNPVGVDISDKVTFLENVKDLPLVNRVSIAKQLKQLVEVAKKDSLDKQVKYLEGLIQEIEKIKTP